MSSAPSPSSILITGANAGIGLQTARVLAQQGHRLILHGRNQARIDAAREQLAQETGNTHMETIWADLAHLSQVRDMAAEIKDRFDPLDVLLNNAGLYSREHQRSADGYELTRAVNHLAPFALTHLLLDHINPAGRIVNVSSVAHTRGKIRFDDLHGDKNYNHYQAYAASKLANVLFTIELARRLPSPAPTVNALHPGVVSTRLLTVGFQMEGFDSLEEGASTSVYLATAPQVAQTTGEYFARSRVAPMNPVVRRPGLAEEFYELSAKLTGIEPLPEPT